MDDRPAERMPRWVIGFLVAGVVIVVVVVAVLLPGAGSHGPERHLPGGDSDVRGPGGHTPPGDHAP